jgi:IS1 family transposase
MRVYLKINGKTHYLWRAVDQDGNVLDILVQSRRNKKAAEKFFRKLLKGLQYVPRVMITDKLARYAAAKREIMASVEHRQHKGLNNRAERSHQPTRQRERTMRRFKSSSPGPTVSLRVWADFGSLSAQTASPYCRGLPCSHAGSLPGLERGGQRKDGRLTANHPFQSSASLLLFSLLFKKALLFPRQVDNTSRSPSLFVFGVERT